MNGGTIAINYGIRIGDTTGGVVAVEGFSGGIVVDEGGGGVIEGDKGGMGAGNVVVGGVEGGIRGEIVGGGVVVGVVGGDRVVEVIQSLAGRASTGSIVVSPSSNDRPDTLTTSRLQ